MLKLITFNKELYLNIWSRENSHHLCFIYYYYLSCFLVFVYESYDTNEEHRLQQTTNNTTSLMHEFLLKSYDVG